MLGLCCPWEHGCHTSHGCCNEFYQQLKLPSRALQQVTRARRAQSSAAALATVLSSVEKLCAPTSSVSPERDRNTVLNFSKALTSAPQSCLHSASLWGLSLPFSFSSGYLWINLWTYEMCSLCKLDWVISIFTGLRSYFTSYLNVEFSNLIGLKVLINFLFSFVFSSSDGSAVFILGFIQIFM